MLLKSKDVGGRMKMGLCVGLLLCASPLFAMNRAQQNCSLQRLASLDLVVTDQILVPVDYRGQTVWMVLDLVLPISLLAPEAVAPLNLTKRNIEGRVKSFVDIGGKPVTATVDIGSLKMGSYRLSRNSLYVDPRPTSVSHTPDRLILGTLGMSDLWAVDFELDLAHHQLNLYSSDHCAGAVAKAWGRSTLIPMELNEFGGVLFPIEANGTRIVASISTLSLDTALSLDVSRHVPGFDEASSSMQFGADTDLRRRGSYRSINLVAGDLQLPNVEVQIVPVNTACTLSKTGRFGDAWQYRGHDSDLCYGIPMVLGRRAIENLRLYFAMQERKIYFAPAEQMLERPASP